MGIDTAELRKGFSKAAGRHTQVTAYHKALTQAAEEIDRLQRIIDSRPAINAGLPGTYIAWSQGIYQTDAAQAAGACVTMRFDTDGGVHVTVDSVEGEQRVVREVNSIRDGIAQLMNPAKELATVKATVKHLKAHPSKGIALMAKAGICTVDGRLKKAYGGDADDDVVMDEELVK